MNVVIGWILLLITMSTFITFVFGYFCYLARSWCVFDSWVEQGA